MSVGSTHYDCAVAVALVGNGDMFAAMTGAPDTGAALPRLPGHRENRYSEQEAPGTQWVTALQCSKLPTCASRWVTRVQNMGYSVVHASILNSLLK